MTAAAGGRMPKDPVPDSSPIELTVIVPTYNEGANVRLLAETLFGAMDSGEDRDYELLFVDDSTDDTPAILAALTREYPRVRVIRRTGERGLGTAILRGFLEARGEVMAVMDGDLQHPPSLLPRMLARVRRGGYDLVLPSRFIPGGSDGGLSLSRKLVSLVARWMARILLARVRRISDPTGGFFMLKKGVVAGADLTGQSWKVLIEVLVKGHPARIAEIPYAFLSRELGYSKLSKKAQIDYLRHLLALFLYEIRTGTHRGTGLSPAPPVDRFPPE